MLAHRTTCLAGLLDANVTKLILLDRGCTVTTWPLYLGKSFGCIMLSSLVQTDLLHRMNMQLQRLVSLGSHGRTAKRLYVTPLHWLHNYLIPQQRMINDFQNDNVYISTKWLMRLVNDSGLVVEQLLCISHMSDGQPHYLTLVGNRHYICNCCMGVNLGIQCQHYFQALTSVSSLLFNIALIRSC